MLIAEHFVYENKSTGQDDDGYCDRCDESVEPVLVSKSAEYEDRLVGNLDRHRERWRVRSMEALALKIIPYRPVRERGVLVVLAAVTRFVKHKVESHWSSAFALHFESEILCVEVIHEVLVLGLL